MKRTLITAVALGALAAATVGAVRVTASGSRIVCLPPAVVQALS